MALPGSARGVNMEKVPVADCTIHFHPRAGMEKNVKALHLEERYERHKATAHKYLLLRQQYDDAKSGRDGKNWECSRQRISRIGCCMESRWMRRRKRGF